ncbi:MAG: hypothetical protein ACJ0DK_11200 [Planctomycetota bacterium]
MAGDRVTVIRAGSVITGTGETISPGEVVIEDGKITLIGNQLEIPDNAKIIEARNQTLMAGTGSLPNEPGADRWKSQRCGL